MNSLVHFLLRIANSIRYRSWQQVRINYREIKRHARSLRLLYSLAISTGHFSNSKHMWKKEGVLLIVLCSLIYTTLMRHIRFLISSWIVLLGILVSEMNFFELGQHPIEIVLSIHDWGDFGSGSSSNQSRKSSSRHVSCSTRSREISTYVLRKIK